MNQKEKNLKWHVAVRAYLALGAPDKDATPVDIHEDILRLIENAEWHHSPQRYTQQLPS